MEGLRVAKLTSPLSTILPMSQTPSFSNAVFHSRALFAQNKVNLVKLHCLLPDVLSRDRSHAWVTRFRKLMVRGGFLVLCVFTDVSVEGSRDHGHLYW